MLVYMGAAKNSLMLIYDKRPEGFLPLFCLVVMMVRFHKGGQKPQNLKGWNHT